MLADLSDMAIDESALALVNGEPWDMHRPFEEDSTLELLRFHDVDPFHVNKAFWRSCSFLLGYACEAVFDESVPIQLHSFPRPIVKSGSFLHDIDLGTTDWTPSREELMTISAKMHRIAQESLPFERLVVDVKLAKEMFTDNVHKKKQLPSIARNGLVTLYRVFNHVDISGGPMIGNTNFLGRRCTITVVCLDFSESHRLLISIFCFFRLIG